MVARIKTVEELSTVEHLSILINYLSVLQDGRAKPDTSGKGGWIREAVYNIDEIEQVKEQINEILRISRKPETMEFDNKFKTKKYF